MLSAIKHLLPKLCHQHRGHGFPGLPSGKSTVLAMDTSGGAEENISAWAADGWMKKWWAPFSSSSSLTSSSFALQECSKTPKRIRVPEYWAQPKQGCCPHNCDYLITRRTEEWQHVNIDMRELGEGDNREGKKKKERVDSKNLHLPHPHQHASLTRVTAEMRLINLPVFKRLKLSGFCLG